MIIDTSKIAGKDYLEERLALIRDKEIYLYGAGSFGKETCYFLEDHGIKIQGFLDRRADEVREYCGYPVYNLENNITDEEKGHALVLFAIVMDKKKRLAVLEQIRAAGFLQVEEAQYYRSLRVTPDDDHGMDLLSYYEKKKKQIAQAYELLADEKSCQIYQANLRAHFTKNFSGCLPLEDDMEEQYFAMDIPFASGYRRFIDCGGFVGDTLDSLFEKKEVEAAVSFEPDVYNYERLIKSCIDRKQEVICFPCAVSDQNGFQRFSAARGSGSICEDGDTTILSVALDAAIHQFRPTFIKMDIEGAEIAALRGAKQMIQSGVPDLAVCVYHNINHIWDAILLLDSWNLGYDFYLRSYNAYTMETVLYATKGAR